MTGSRIASLPTRHIAVLGPTNTGKTHLAVERMLGFSSGMIGLPLRLLAREIYDRIVKARGAAAVALVTGEEKIVPVSARYWVCTVEAMPLDRQVEFLAVDEIQLCADPERGHVFTHRLLNARGISETMLLGAASAAGLIRRLCPEFEIQSRDRFSQLHLRRPEEADPPAAAQRHRRLLRRCGLRHRRIDPPPSRRRCGRHGLALAPHPQRPGRAVPVGRGRFSRRDRRDRHGPQHGRRSRRLRRRCASSTAGARAGCIITRSARSPGAPAATAATAHSA